MGQKNYKKKIIIFFALSAQTPQLERRRPENKQI
jgi:hypothetical protein